MLVPMDILKDEEIIQLLIIGDLQSRNKAMEELHVRYFKKCLPVIRKTTWKKTDSEYQSIFNEALEVFCNKVIEGSFEYRETQKLLSYLKKGCYYKALEDYHKNINENEVDGKNIEGYSNYHYQGEELDAENDFLEDKLGRYDIELDFEEDEDKEQTKKEDVRLDDLIRAFQTLSDICKFLIILKFFAKQSHQQIADTLRFMFGLSDADVSKTYLNRCMNRIKEKLL
jgi:DNA-directed RNA polymerase specialized sigma24 family protein